MDWKLLTFLVCCFGFFKDLRPSEAYLTTYLTSEWKNLTLEQVNNEIYPWWTYSYAIWLIPVFAFTDYFRYRSLLILDSSAYIMTWVLILWAKGIPAMTVMQVSYGLATAGEIGYFSYLYSMVDKSHFQKVASFTRCSSLAGRFTAYLLGQFIVSYKIFDLFQLNAFSFSSVSLAFAIAIFLPKSKTSKNIYQEVTIEEISKSLDEKMIMQNCDTIEDKKTKIEKQSDTIAGCNESFETLEPRADIDMNQFQNHMKEDIDCDKIVYKEGTADTNWNVHDKTDCGKNDEVTLSSILKTVKPIRNVNDKTEFLEQNTPNKDISESFSKTFDSYNGIFVSIIKFLKAIKHQIKHTYSNRTVMIWSVWWITASCGNLQVGSYIQNLWEVIAPHKQSSDIYNGAVEAAGTLTGSICVALVGFVPVQWAKIGRSELLMTSVCAMKAVILVVMATTNEIWVAYVLYGIFRVLYQVAITVETAEIAKALTGSHYGFVFGCNMFLALVIESIFTAVVVDDVGFGVDVRTQFMAYGLYSGLMFIVFLAVTLVTVFKHRNRTEEEMSANVWSTMS